MGEVYEAHKDTDNFVYFAYTDDDAFGWSWSVFWNRPNNTGPWLADLNNEFWLVVQCLLVSVGFFEGDGWMMDTEKTEGHFLLIRWIN